MAHDAGLPHQRTHPTLVQVATLAGVSPKTASRALNGEPNVAEPTRVRVLVAANRLGFRPNGIARELRRGGTSTLVGLISGDLANPFYSTVASGIERELREHGLQLVMASNDEGPRRERTLVEAFLERRVRALLIMSSSSGSDPGGSFHAERSCRMTEGPPGVPFVFLDYQPAGLPCDAVVIANAEGGRLAAEHLLARGHSRVAVLGDPPRYATHRDRFAGFADAMNAAGNHQWSPYAHSDVHDVATAERAILALMNRDPVPTAIFTLDNRLTTGALRALAHRRYQPALVGFDDFELADVLGVTVIAHDGQAMGREAARLALTGPSEHPRRQRIVTMPIHLVVRGSGERTP
ncbi:MAG: LacI family DNA-binding transcriptional regulator [Micromonosporaceae bacterium]|nr:LacI family DNA-binding transcriptional regulator [Micromonosporaceae bacterium]